MNGKTPARSNVVVVKQLLNLIPRSLINRHAMESAVDAKARTFTVSSHLAAMLFAQLSHAIGLNDVCDWLRLKAPVLARFGLTAPTRNALSHANKHRNADFIHHAALCQDRQLPLLPQQLSGTSKNPLLVK